MTKYPGGQSKVRNLDAAELNMTSDGSLPLSSSVQVSTGRSAPEQLASDDFQGLAKLNWTFR